MIIIKLEDGFTFNAESISESKRLKDNYRHNLTITVNDNINDVDYYEDILSKKNVLNTIEAIADFGIVSFNGFTEVHSISRMIEHDGIKIRISLVIPGEEVK